MPYTEEERRLKRNEASKRWREKHKKKIAEYNEEYKEKHKEEIAEQRKEYYKTPNGKRSKRIGNWKHIGLKVDDYNEIYDRWLNSEKCEKCNKEYFMTKGGYLDKCLEHNHTTGEFRNICCSSCNQQMRWNDEKNI